MGDVEEQQGTRLVGDGPELFGVDLPGIGGGAADDHLRLVFHGEALHLGEVDPLGVLVDPVGDYVVELAREIDRGAVGEMPSVGEVHGQDGVARLENGEVDGHVRLGPRMGLDIHVVAAEELLRPVPGEVLRPVHHVAAAVIPGMGVPFRILVGHNRPHGGEDSPGDEIFRCYEFDAVPLPLELVGDGAENFRVGVAKKFLALL